MISLLDKVLGKSVKNSDIKRQYAIEPSIVDYLPFVDFDDESSTVLLSDGHSVGKIYKLLDFSSEAKSEEFLKEKAIALANFLKNSVKLEENNPWIIQFYVMYDYDYSISYEKQTNYINENNNRCDNPSKNDPIAKKYLEILQSHWDYFFSSDGICEDPTFKRPLKGRVKKCYVTLYRKYSKKPKDVNVLREIEEVGKTFEQQSVAVGLKVKSCNEKDFAHFMFKWFNQNNFDKFNNYFIEREKRSYAYSLRSNLFSSNPSSDEHGNWIIDSKYHRLMTFKPVNGHLDIGVISREKGEIGVTDKTCLFDSLPDNCIYTLQLVFESVKQQEAQLTKIEKTVNSTKGTKGEINQNVQIAKDQVKRGNYLYRMYQGVYFSGDDLENVEEIERRISNIFSVSRINAIIHKDDLFPLDTFIKFLPFSFDVDYDKTVGFKSSYQYLDDIVRILPIWGRSRGDDMSFCHINYNRGGEVALCDFLSPTYKSYNSHHCIFGTTGSGKSVDLNYKILQYLAVHNARVVALEVGGSFDNTFDFVKKYGGRDCVQWKFDINNPMAVNPWGEWERALEQYEESERHRREIELKYNSNVTDEQITEQIIDIESKKLEEIEKDLKKDEKYQDVKNTGDEARDYLNEFTVTAVIMITRADEKNQADMTYANKALIKKAIIRCLKNCKEKGVKQMLTSHLQKAFEEESEAQKLEKNKNKLADFATSLDEYTQGIKSSFFNRESEKLNDFDFLHVDLTAFQDTSSNLDSVSLIVQSICSKVMAIAEATVNTGRPTILILDECHIYTKFDMVVTYLVLVAKVARKINLWLVPATQNLTDLQSKELTKFLTMMEHWIIMSLNKSEIELVQKYKTISEEDKLLLQDTKTVKKKYSESVILTSKKENQGLVRNIPPREFIALAMTEAKERQARAKIMEEHNIDNVDACLLVAEQMKKYQNDVNNNLDYFNF